MNGINGNQGQGFFFGITLGELGFILFFIVLLLAVWKLNDKDKEIEEKDDIINQARERDQTIQAIWEYLEKEGIENNPKDLYARIKLLQNTQEKMSALEEQLKSLQEVLIPLVDLAERRGWPSPLTHSKDFLIKLESELTIADEARKVFPRLSSDKEISKAISIIPEDTRNIIQNGIVGEKDKKRDSGKYSTLGKDELLRRLQDMEALVSYLQEKINKMQGGLDRPPCWLNHETKKIQFLFNVSIMNELIRLDSIAPESRQKEYFSIPSVQSITGRNLEVAEFRVLAEPILEYAKAKPTNCRYFVLYDYIGPQGSMSHLTMEAMETYFYKLKADIHRQ